MAHDDETVLGLASVDGRKPRIAIVGGTPASALVATVLVEQFGCLPVSAPTGEAVLALLHGEDPLDLVMIDLPVPDMDGIDAVQLIRALGNRGELPVMALVGDDARIDTPRARAAGFCATVKKPYSPRELYGALQTALSRPLAASTESA